MKFSWPWKTHVVVIFVLWMLGIAALCTFFAWHNFFEAARSKESMLILAYAAGIGTVVVLLWMLVMRSCKKLRDKKKTVSELEA